MRIDAHLVQEWWHLEVQIEESLPIPACCWRSLFFRRGSGQCSRCDVCRRRCFLQWMYRRRPAKAYCSTNHVQNGPCVHVMHTVDYPHNIKKNYPSDCPILVKWLKSNPYTSKWQDGMQKELYHHYHQGPIKRS